MCTCIIKLYLWYIFTKGKFPFQSIKKEPIRFPHPQTPGCGKLLDGGSPNPIPLLHGPAATRKSQSICFGDCSWAPVCGQWEEGNHLILCKCSADENLRSGFLCVCRMECGDALSRQGRDTEPRSEGSCEQGPRGAQSPTQATHWM